MAIFDKLLNIAVRTEPPKQEEIAVLKSDRRYHERIPTTDSGLVNVEIAGKAFALIDISYSGLAVRIPDQEARPFALGVSMTGAITTPTGRAACEFMPVRVSNDQRGAQIVGLAFKNQPREFLGFLRDIIEPLRQATSLALIDQDHLKTSRKEQGITCWRGEGPCDLEVYADHSFSITFLMKNGQYGNVRWRDNNLSTSITVGTSFAGVQQVVGTERISPSILQHGALILAGACVKHGTLLPSLKALVAEAIRLKACV